MENLAGITPEKVVHAKGKQDLMIPEHALALLWGGGRASAREKNRGKESEPALAAQEDRSLHRVAALYISVGRGERDD